MNECNRGNPLTEPRRVPRLMASPIHLWTEPLTRRSASQLTSTGFKKFQAERRKASATGDPPLED